MTNHQDPVPGGAPGGSLPPPAAKDLRAPDRGGAIAPTARPRMLGLVVGGYVGTAILNLVVGTWTLAFVPAALDAAQKAGRTVTAGGVFLSFALIAVAALAYSITIVVLALRLSRGHSWARPALLSVSVLSLAAIVTSGAPGLAVVLLLLVLAILVTRPQVSAWLRAVKESPGS